MMSARDRLDMLAIVGVTVALTADGGHLDVDGPAVMVDAAIPTLRQHRAALVAELRRRAEQEGTATHQ
jgi:hypothetical protein